MSENDQENTHERPYFRFHNLTMIRKEIPEIDRKRPDASVFQHIKEILTIKIRNDKMHPDTWMSTMMLASILVNKQSLEVFKDPNFNWETELEWFKKNEEKLWDSIW